MSDLLTALRDRVVVYDGGMGATLEQFDLSLERDYRLPGRCHEALVLNRPDVIEGVHASMLEAGAEVLETDTFQGSRLKLGEWGLEDHVELVEPLGPQLLVVLDPVVNWLERLTVGAVQAPPSVVTHVDSSHLSKHP